MILEDSDEIQIGPPNPYLNQTYLIISQIDC